MLFTRKAFEYLTMDFKLKIQSERNHSLLNGLRPELLSIL